MEAIERKLAGYRRNHEEMKLANRYLRAGDDEGLRRMGYADFQIAMLRKPDSKGRIGFDGRILKNNVAAIERLEKQLEAAKGNQQ